MLRVWSIVSAGSSWLEQQNLSLCNFCSDGKLKSPCQEIIGRLGNGHPHVIPAPCCCLRLYSQAEDFSFSKLWLKCIIFAPHQQQRQKRLQSVAQYSSFSFNYLNHTYFNITAPKSVYFFFLGHPFHFLLWHFFWLICWFCKQNSKATFEQTQIPLIGKLSVQLILCIYLRSSS